MKKIIKYVLWDILRNRVVMLYSLLLLVVSFTVFLLEDTAAKGLLSLLNVVLIIVPMICLVFSTIYYYNSSEFIELLVSQPLRRKRIWLSIFAGLAGALALAVLIGIGIPVLLFERSMAGFVLVAVAVVLSIIFVSIALLAAVRTRDKAKGIGKAVLLWLFLSLIYDGIVLFLLFQFSDYPLEKPMIAMSFLNPIDLGRILILLHLDVAALMGYTGAIFKDFFGTTLGIAVSACVLLIWMAVPLWLSTRFFDKKDL
ncbi:MAG: ABC transporter permease subunit [Chitinophagaceae bacterium]